jgi:hypothetical protein
MKPYGNSSGNSGVAAYEYANDRICMRFVREPEPYTYLARTIGSANFEEMKRRADAGKGLATFINTHPEVRNGCNPHKKK